MKFSIGDKVILKRTGEEGYVTAYINQQMIEIDVQGTIFPVYIDEIDHPYLKWFTEKKKAKPQAEREIPVEKEKFRKPRLAKGIYLSFIPVFKPDEMEDVVDHLKIYLLNELPQSVKLKYDVRYANESEFRHEGKLHGFGHLYLHSIAYADMNDQPRFHWQLTDADNAAMAHAEGILRIRPAKLFEHISQLLQNNEPSFSYLLLQEFFPPVATEKPDKFEAPVIKPFITSSNISTQVEPAQYEVDLHIEKLVDSTGLSNTEMLKIQLDAFHKYLHLAIVHKQEHMMVIHGLGKGKLKHEVHKILSRTPEVHKFANEYDGRYGFGATEIIFRY